MVARDAGAEPRTRSDCGRLVIRLYLNSLFSLASFSDVVGGLHPHQRIHLDPKCLFNTERHVARQVGLTVEQAGERGP